MVIKIKGIKGNKDMLREIGIIRTKEQGQEMKERVLRRERRKKEQGQRHYYPPLT